MNDLRGKVYQPACSPGSTLLSSRISGRHSLWTDRDWLLGNHLVVIIAFAAAAAALARRDEDKPHWKAQLVGPHSPSALRPRPLNTCVAIASPSTFPPPRWTRHGAHDRRRRDRIKLTKRTSSHPACSREPASKVSLLKRHFRPKLCQCFE